MPEDYSPLAVEQGQLPSRPGSALLDATGAMVRTRRIAIPGNAGLLVATHTDDKAGTFQDVIALRCFPARVFPLSAGVDTYQSPNENRGNFADHAIMKLMAGHAAARATRNLDDRLADLGLERPRALIMAEDGGIVFRHSREIFAQKEFAPVRHLFEGLPPDKLPGVNTSPIIAACGGATGFFQKVDRALSRLSASPDLVAISHMAISSLEAPNDIMHVEGRVKGVFIATPRPPNSGSTIGHHIVLKDGHTEMELGAAGTPHTSKGVTLRKLLALGGLTEGTPYVPAATSRRDFTIGVISSAPLDIEARPGVQVSNIVPDTAKLADIGAMLARPSHLVFAGPAPASATRALEWQLIAASAVVAKQTHDKTVWGKGVAIVSALGNKEPVAAQIHDFHRHGAVPQLPDELLKVYPTLDAALRAAEKARHAYVPLRAPEYPETFTGKPSPKLFDVAMLLSATYEHEEAKLDIKRSVGALARRNNGLVTGGGESGLMGVATYTISDIRKTHRLSGAPAPWHGASSVPNIMLNEGNVIAEVDAFLHAPNIYRRMEYIIGESDAAWLKRGGMGSAPQEAGAFAWLASRLKDNPADEYAGSLVRGKSLIVENRDGYYNQFLSGLPRGQLESLGIIVTTRAEESLDVLKTLEARKRATVPRPLQGVMARGEAKPSERPTPPG